MGPRLGRAAASALVLASAASACVNLSTTGTPSLPASIGELLARPDGGTIVVQDGRYKGGVVRTTHRDWLVLVAKTRGGVTVTSPLDLTSPAAKVAFVGFRFRALVSLRGARDVLFWYADATNPARGYVGSRPTFLWIGGDKDTGMHSARITVAGSDIHDVGDDGIQVGGAADTIVEGVRIWNVDNAGVTAAWHNDTIQLTGGTTDFVARHVDLTGHVQIKTDFGPIAGVRLEDFWLRSSPNAGIVYASTEGRTITGTRSRGWSWGHRFGDRIDYRDDIQQTAGNAATIRVTDVGVTAAPPPVGAVSPAGEWRAQHPYDSWAEALPGFVSG